MNPDRQCCSYIVPIPSRRLRTVVGTMVGVAATVLVADDASAADKPSLPPRTSAVSCVVDVSDWPLAFSPMTPPPPSVPRLSGPARKPSRIGPSVCCPTTSRVSDQECMPIRTGLMTNNPSPPTVGARYLAPSGRIWHIRSITARRGRGRNGFELPRRRPRSDHGHHCRAQDDPPRHRRRRSGQSRDATWFRRPKSGLHNTGRERS